MELVMDWPSWIYIYIYIYIYYLLYIYIVVCLMKVEDSLALSKHISSNVFKKGYGFVLWRLNLVSFSMWQ